MKAISHFLAWGARISAFVALLEIGPLTAAQPNPLTLDLPLDYQVVQRQTRQEGIVRVKGVHFSGKGLREHAAHWVEKVSPWLETQLHP